LNMGLKESNHDQLYVYLKQHESHANENKMLMERLNQYSYDPLALVSNVSPYQYPSSSAVPPKPSYTPPGRKNRVQGNNARGIVAAGNGGLSTELRPQNSDYFKENMLLMQAQENEVAPTAQTMFMDNLSSADPVYDKDGPSYDSNTLSEVHDHNNYLDNMNESHKEHKIHNDVQPNGIVDSDTEYTSNSNIISYEQYVQDYEDQVVHSDVSFVSNDAVLIITNDIYE
ncbi:hypothetical protein Tco_1280924, partial [Tanacetum coccineum]